MLKSKKPKRKTSPSNGVYMPYKKNVNPKRKKNILKSKKVSKRRKSYNKENIIKILIIGLVGIVVIALVYLSVRFIINMRSDLDENYEETYVVGLQDIPTYPNSEFIFENNMEESSISNFISQGNSAYRLPNNTTIEDVYEYYQEKLTTLGWQYVLSVNIGAEDMKSGEYWIKENGGLRLYTKFNDVWYETVSKAQAETGLADKVAEETERELLLAGDDTQDLLPDYPWVLEVPKSYVISYGSGVMEDYRYVSFKEIGGSEEIIITPVSNSGLQALDYSLEDYILYLGEGNNGILNTVLISNILIRGTINANGDVHLCAVLTNTYNNINYVIDANSTESEFFEYILSNIQNQDSTTY